MLDIQTRLERENDHFRELHEQASARGSFTLETALQRFRQRHFSHAFSQWKGSMHATLDGRDQPHLPCMARRLFYRWWRMSHGEHHVAPEHPCDAWLLSEREETGIYPEHWIDQMRSKPTWSACPWFLDYPDGEYPEEESDQYKELTRKKKNKALVQTQSHSTAQHKEGEAAREGTHGTTKRPAPTQAPSSSTTHHVGTEGAMPPKKGKKTGKKRRKDGESSSSESDDDREEDS